MDLEDKGYKVTRAQLERAPTCFFNSLRESWMLRIDWNTGDSSTDIRVFRSSFTFDNKLHIGKVTLSDVQKLCESAQIKGGHERTWAFARRSSVSLTDC